MASELKPTFNKPISPVSKGYETNFNKAMVQNHVKLNEIDELLGEAEKSLKKKIFSLAKMEALVFSDPKLSAVYDDMAQNGEEKYGYHYNETVMNIIFNDYVLNSPKYLQKYKMAIPKEKKRRDKSGINQLKKTGEKAMHTTKPPKLAPTGLKPVTESDEERTKVMFLVNETNPEFHDLFAYFPEMAHNDKYKTGYSHVGQHSPVDPKYAEESRPATPEEYADLKNELENMGYNLEVMNSTNETTGAGGGAGGGFSGSGQYSQALGYKNPVDETTGSASSGAYVGPAVWGSGDLMKSKGTANVKKVPMVKGGTIIQENKNYLVDPSGFENYIKKLNEEDLSYQTKLGQDYQQSHSGSNSGMGVSEIPQDNKRNQLKKGIDDNTALYIGQDVDKMKDNDVKILHNDMTKRNTYFPHPNNPNLPEDGISGKHQNEQVDFDDAQKPNVKPYTNNKVNNKIIDKTSAFTSTTVKNWDRPDSKIELNTVDHGTVDEPNLKTMEENKKIDEKAKSKEQQRLFGMAHAVQKGELSPNKVGGAVKKIAKTVSPEDVEDFASTKHENLPEKVNESISPDRKQMIDQIGIMTDKLDDDDPPSGMAGIYAKRIYNKLSDDAVNNAYNKIKMEYDKKFGKPNSINEGYNPDMYSTKEDLKHLLGIIKQRGQTFDVWLKNGSATLAGEALHAVAIAMANKMLPMRWDDLPDTNSMWDYIDENGNMGYNRLMEAVKEAVNDRLSEEGESLGSLGLDETNLSMVDDSQNSMSNKPTPTGNQTSGVPMGMQNTGGMSESYNSLLEEINNELNAFAIHQDKLKKMTEDRKPSALVLKDRVTADNPKNFKKDLKDSSVSKLVDIENALEYSDQQTEVKDPYKLGQDIEKTAIKSGDMKSGEALKNVGSSDNAPGDEIPKRNLTPDEENDVNNYRLGLGDYIYDNKPSKRFEERMEKDMTKRNYDLRKKKIEARSNNNLYNKSTQPTDNGIDMVQYNKEKSGWNDREGIKESIVSGKYFDDLSKKRIIDFKLNEARKLFDIKAIDNLHEISLEGMGNSYTSKVDVNEDVVKSISENKYYTNGKDVFVVKNPVQKLNENGQVNEKRPINNDFEKMKHLLNFNSNNFVDTKNVKKNRGF